MLFVEYVIEYGGHSIVGSRLVEHLEIAFLIGEIVNSVVNIAYAGFVKLTFARKYCIA